MEFSIIVGPFPSEINESEKNELLFYFGATEVNHVFTKRKKCYSLAKFNDEKLCKKAVQTLHQMFILDVRINAKYVNPSLDSMLSLKPVYVSKTDIDLGQFSQISHKYEEEINVSPAKFNHSINPSLRYSYPEPSSTVLANITHAMISVPKLYFQVLHLMNKMNLPCPFKTLPSETPALNNVKNVAKIFDVQNCTKILNEDSEVIYQQNNETETFNPTSSESEIETDAVVGLKTNIKRLRRQSKHKVNKKMKLEDHKKLVERPENLNIKSRSEIKDVFEVSNMPKQKISLEVKLQDKVQNIVEKNVFFESAESFGKIDPSLKSHDFKTKVNLYISQDELDTNRIPESEWPIVPVFKNYNAGTPSLKLYIKNIAKNVTENDLKFIFGGFVQEKMDGESIDLGIRIMKEGRMKGQAFITFPSPESAAKALKNVNGYILKDKPLVIMFAKVKEQVT